MKSFTEILIESEKSYPFKIGIAGDIPDGCEDMLETCLKRYGVKNMTSGKRTPIQSKPLDFPSLDNCHVTYYEVDLTYPTTDAILKEYVGSCCNIDQTHIYVVTPGQEEVRDGNQAGEARTESDGPYEALLDSDYIDPVKTDAAQANVAGNRVMDLLKELEKARAERKNDPMEGAPKGDSRDITNEENAVSAIGSK